MNKNPNIKYFILPLIISAICYFLFDFLRWQEHDMKSFIEGSKLLLGDDSALNLQDRISKPIPLLAPGLLHWTFSSSIIHIILIQNILSLIMLIFFAYKNEYIRASKPILPLLFMTGPFAVFSLFIQSDIMVWTIQIIHLYYLFKWNQEKGLFVKSNLICNSLFMLSGLLIKESMLINIMFFFFLALFEIDGYINRFLKLASTFFILIGTYVFIQYWINIKFGANTVKRSLIANDAFEDFKFNIDYLKQLFRVIETYWFIIGLGLFHIIKKKLWKNDSFLKASIFTTLCFLIIAPFFKFYVQDRILFMIVPILIPFFSEGIKHIYRKELIWILGILNIASTYLIYKFNVSIIPYIILFSLISFATNHYFYKRNNV